MVSLPSAPKLQWVISAFARALSYEAEEMSNHPCTVDSDVTRLDGHNQVASCHEGNNVRCVVAALGLNENRLQVPKKGPN